MSRLVALQQWEINFTICKLPDHPANVSPINPQPQPHQPNPNPSRDALGYVGLFNRVQRRQCIVQDGHRLVGLGLGLKGGQPWGREPVEMVTERR